MNKKLKQITLWASLVTQASIFLVAETVYDLDKAILQALDQNFQIQIDRIEPQVADQAVRGAKGFFDPTFESTYTYRNTELTAFAENEESAEATVGVGGFLPWGTEYFAGVDLADSTTPFNSVTQSFTDTVNSFSGISITQPLLRNFGLTGSYSAVRIAREGRRISDEFLRLSVMRVITNTVRAYQDLYFAQENLRISKRNRDLAKQLLKDNRKRVETGVLAPLDIVQAESEAALREVSVISAEALLSQEQNRLKALLFSQKEDINKISIEIYPPQAPVRVEPSLAYDLGQALKNRPELLQAEVSLNISELELKQTRRNALPQLDLVASYGRYGQGDDLNESLNQSFSDGRESYSLGAVIRIPFPNRARSAEKVSAYLRRNQESLRRDQLEQQIRLQVDDAITQVRADWLRIQATQEARRLAEKALEAEEKKLQAGTSSTFIVLRLQGDLAFAEIREIIALTDYAKSVAVYDLVCGVTLEKYAVSLAN